MQSMLSNLGFSQCLYDSIWFTVKGCFYNKNLELHLRADSTISRSF